ncbi:MAG: hypothetical protein R2814_07985 [Flavobacteriaceae bacterium]
MYRALKKYILLLCILLINGFNTIYAHSNFEVDGYFSVINAGISESSHCGEEPELAPIIFEHTFAFEFQKLHVAEVTDTEEEEEESDEITLSSETNLIYGVSATAIFYAQMLEHLSSYLGKDRTYIDCLPYTTPCKRYIWFQVFRI